MKAKKQEKGIVERHIHEEEPLIKTGEINIKHLNEFLSHIREISNKTGTHIICLNADMIAGITHAKLAIKLAARSFLRDRNPISNSFEMEVLLYAGGTRQCADAGKFGVHEGYNRIYICIYPKNDEVIEELNELVTFTEDNNNIDERKYRRLALQFGISDKELLASGNDRLADLILERVALLDIIK